jgi:hypothetical protein
MFYWFNTFKIFNFFLTLNFSINYENCEEMLHRFTEHSKKSKGKMTLKDFSTYLGLPPSGSVVQIFNMYDKVSSIQK